jgi:hypothetical protein
MILTFEFTIKKPHMSSLFIIAAEIQTQDPGKFYIKGKGQIA